MIAAHIRRPIGARNDKLVGTVARAHRVADEGQRKRAARAPVSGRHPANVRRRHRRSAIHCHRRRTGNARWRAVLDGDGLDAIGVIAAQVGGAISPRDHELIKAVARAHRVADEGQGH